MANTTSNRTSTVYTAAMSEAVRSVAQYDYIARDKTLPVHLAYSNATYAEEQAEIKVGFCVDWIMGDRKMGEKVSLEEAETIYAAGVGKNAINANAVWRARSAFTQHVIRPADTIEASSDETPKAKTPKAASKPATKSEQAALAMFIQLVGSRKRALELVNAAK